jgi:hypothetical protein
MLIGGERIVKRLGVSTFWDSGPQAARWRWRARTRAAS